VEIILIMSDATD